MRFPSLAEYQLIQSFNKKYYFEEKEPGYYIARANGLPDHYWDAHKGQPGIFWNPPKNWFSPGRHDILPRPVTVESLDDFGWKLMCALIVKGEL
jgi:hypothetical protein